MVLSSSFAVSKEAMAASLLSSFKRTRPF